MRMPFTHDDHADSVVVFTLLFALGVFVANVVAWIVSPLPPVKYHVLHDVERVVVDDPSATEFTLWTREHGVLVPRVVRGYSAESEIREDAVHDAYAEWWMGQHWYDEDEAVRIVVHVRRIADVGDGAWHDKHGSHTLHSLPTEPARP